MELMSLKQIADQYGHTYKAVHSFAKYHNIKPAEKRRIEGVDRSVHFFDPTPFAEHYSASSVYVEEITSGSAAPDLEPVNFEFPPLSEVTSDLIDALRKVFCDDEVRNIIINHYGVDPHENI